MCAGRPRIRIGSPFRCTHVLRLKLRRRTRGTIGRIQRFAAGFNWARGEDIYRRDDRSISGTRARWGWRADGFVEGDARGVPFRVMSAPTADVVIWGGGIAGVAAASHLAVRRGVTDVVLVDERPPLSLTSDKSTECYRNWWPGPGDEMVALMNRSIDLLEELARESGNAFRMSRRGYLFVTADAERVPTFVRAAEEAGARGARGGRGRARAWRHGSDARRRAHVLDPALRERGGPVRPAGQSAHRRRAPGVLRASRQGRLQRRAPCGAARGADDDLDGSRAARVVD